MKRILISFFLAILLVPRIFQVVAATDEKPAIFPIPREIRLLEGIFLIDDSLVILIPQAATKNDEFLAHLISNEFTDKYEHPVLIDRSNFPGKYTRTILMGDISNPLVKAYCEKTGWIEELKDLGEEGYMLSVGPDKIVVASLTPKGSLYGLESLRQIIRSDHGKLYVPCIFVKDSPKFPFRGIKLYLPGRENITFFKRFIKDFVALYKFNKIILELNANMRLEKHPELNIGAVQFARYLNYSRLDRPPGIHNEFQNSSHQDNADGGILEKAEVADIVNYIRQFNIEVIPELPSLTHSYYLLWGHKELAENLAQPFPDTYCPLKPESYKIYFDVLDEYIDVIHPLVIHVGHDEWRMEKDLCKLCRGKDYGDLYAADLNRIHDYLAGKGIRTAIWGDHLLESVTQKDFQLWKSSSGYQYKIPGALRPEQVQKSIPKDILIFNWFWDEPDNDRQISDFGFSQVYGNMRADINDWNKRFETRGLLGGAPSSWAATTEKNFGKDQLTDFLGCSNLLWSEKYLAVEDLANMVEPIVESIRYNFTGTKMPSDAGSKISTLDISEAFNSSLSGVADSPNINNLISGQVTAGNKIFNIKSLNQGGRAVVAFTQAAGAKPESGNGIHINNDVNSLLFLHACAKEAANRKAYSTIFSFDETADLLGWYEVVYEDGFVETIPLRYGLNILDWGCRKRIRVLEPPKVEYSQNQYAYEAEAVQCSKYENDPVLFFAYEWINPRFGKKIREVNLRAVDFNGKNENAIVLLGISVAENSKTEPAKGAETK